MDPHAADRAGRREIVGRLCSPTIFDLMTTPAPRNSGWGSKGLFGEFVFDRRRCSMDAKQKLAELEKIVTALRDPAERLAVSIGNYRGTNDLTATRRRLFHPYILDDFRNDLIAMIVIRAFAIVADPRRPTDVTLRGAAGLLRDSDVRGEVVDRSKQWHTTRADLEGSVDRFLEIMANLDIATLTEFRHRVLAHVTTKPRPGLQVGTALRIGDEILDATDNLIAAVRGTHLGLVSLSKHRREQSLYFWEHFDPNDRIDAGQTDSTDTGEIIP
jgi:hypothetical protein